MRVKVRYEIPWELGWTAIGDLSGDKQLDFVANMRPRRFAVFLGGGDGTLKMLPPLDVPRALGLFAIGDLDSDGKMDVASSFDTPAMVALLFNRGGGTLDQPVTYAFPDDLYSIAIGNQDNAGGVDVIVNDSYRTRVLYGLGNRKFEFDGNHFGFWSSSGGVIATDLDKDGNTDLVVSGYEGIGGKVNILFGEKNRKVPDVLEFRLPAAAPLSFPLTLVADISGDGRLDVVSAMDRPPQLAVLIAMGNRKFTQEKPAIVPLPIPRGRGFSGWFVSGDFDGDGDEDLAASYEFRDVVILLNDGTGTFGQISTIATSSVDYGYSSIAAGDLNGDRKVDLVVVASRINSGKSTITVFLGR